MSEFANGLEQTSTKIIKYGSVYMKVAMPTAYLTIKLFQFLARGVKAKFFDKENIENFAKFIKKCNGEYDIYNVPFKADAGREAGVEEFKNYLEGKGFKYSVLPKINDEPTFQIAIPHSNQNNFNILFNEYIKANLSGGEKSQKDLVNFTDGKTTIISIPDDSVESMVTAMNDLSINYAKLPDFILDDGEKQFRIATVDKNAAQQAFEAYRRSLIGSGLSKENVNAQVMKEMSDNEYLSGANITAEEYMNSASDEIREKIEEFNKKDLSGQMLEIVQFEYTIKPEDSYECMVHRLSNNFYEISLDKETLVDNIPVANHLQQLFPAFFFTKVPGTAGQEILKLPKTDVFEAAGSNGKRLVAFVRKDRMPSIFNSAGDLNPKYDNAEQLMKHFDLHNKKDSIEDALNSIKAPAMKIPIK